MDPSLLAMTRYNELWKPGGTERAESVVAPNFARYGSSGEFTGVPALKRYIAHYLDAFPDIRFAVDDWLAQAGKVVIRYRFTGTHERAFMGIAASRRPIRAEGVAIYRIAGGQLVELWDYLDLFGIAVQLGVPLTSIKPELSWK